MPRTATSTPRLRQIGVRPGSYPGEYTASIPHSDVARTAHYAEPDKLKSQRLFDSYHTSKIDWMLKHNRLPERGQKKELLVAAHKATGAPLPQWYTEERSSPEPPPIVEVTPGTPKPVVPAAETNALVPITETMSEPTPTPVSTARHARTREHQHQLPEAYLGRPARVAREARAQRRSQPHSCSTNSMRYRCM